MSPIPLLIAGLVVFLLGIGGWAFSLTGNLETDIGQAPIALTLAGVVIAGLIAGFLWLGQQHRD